MFKKIIEMVRQLDEIIKPTEEEFTVDVARKNYQKYLDSLKEEREKYKSKLCDEIKIRANCGHKYILTSTIDGYYRFIDKDYLNELKDFFESKGFIVEWKTVGNIGDECYLRISWEID